MTEGWVNAQFHGPTKSDAVEVRYGLIATGEDQWMRKGKTLERSPRDVLRAIGRFVGFVIRFLRPCLYAMMSLNLRTRSQSASQRLNLSCDDIPL